ncbi:hypothetical protein [Roseivirga pacifica]|uniref:hypothetical protein n=1 Tax=Roseivirga pacifica TaxID=1267423 RepID=UPI003BACF5AA
MKREELLFWKGKARNGFLIIQNHDLHAGYGALLLYALNGIRKAESINAIPIIDFNEKSCPYFYDAKWGTNIWEYFFEKVSSHTLQEINDWIKEGLLSDQEVHFISSSEAAQAHQHDPERLATFWAWETPINKVSWMKEKRALGRKYVQEYIRPKEHILKKVESFIATQFKASFIIGIHIRGSDFAYAKPTPIQAYFEEVDRLVDERNDKDYQIYVATDQSQYLDEFEKRYSGKVIYLNAVRSDNHIAPFRFEEISGYQKGEEVLLDILLLSKCQQILKGAAATGELALWFCNHNNITDFALQSEFNKKKYSELESTYSQLNVGNKSKTSRKTQILRERIIRRFIESKIGKVIYYRSTLARKILKH